MLDKTLVIGVMLAPTKEKLRKDYIEELKNFRKKHPEMILAYFNWISRFDDLIDDDMICLTEEGCQDVEVPCYRNSIFDVIVDVPIPEPELAFIKDSDEFVVFEEMCDAIVSPIVNESVSKKFCTFDYAKHIAYAHNHKKSPFDYMYDNNGRIILEFKPGFIFGAE